MKRLLIFPGLLFMGIFCTEAQIITEANISATIESNLIVSTNTTWDNNGNIQNEGSIELTTGDWNNTNIYTGAGSITLSNAGTQNFGHNDQEIATLVLSGADKTITSGFKVTSQLDMPTGLSIHRLALMLLLAME